MNPVQLFQKRQGPAQGATKGRAAANGKEMELFVAYRLLGHQNEQGQQQPAEQEGAHPEGPEQHFLLATGHPPPPLLMQKAHWEVAIGGGEWPWVGGMAATPGRVRDNRGNPGGVDCRQKVILGRIDSFFYSFIHFLTIANEGIFIKWTKWERRGAFGAEQLGNHRQWGNAMGSSG